MRSEIEARSESKLKDDDRQLSGETEEEALADSFFSEPPKSEPVDLFSDLETGSDDKDDDSRARHSRRAMMATFVILGVAIVGISSYTVYAKILMPTPVAIGAITSLPELPQPLYSDIREQSPKPQNGVPNPKPVKAISSEPEAPPVAPTGAVEQAAPATPTPDESVAAVSEPQMVEQPVGATGQSEPVAAQNAAAISAGHPVKEANAPKDEKGTSPNAATPAIPKVVSTSNPAAVEREKPVIKERRPVSTAGEKSQSPAEYAGIVARANALYRHRRTRKQAVEEYKRALTLNPNGDDALRKLSYYYLNQGRGSEAEQYAERAVRANQENSQSWLLLGAARDALNDREGAQQAYRNCAQGKGAFATQCKTLLR
ncbi:MAG: hypothetical protein JXA30_07910 [Deltaproteobacteria bacterium]|nr:hypothetical protein [Deltaproteobacteria bacterium]